MLLFKAKKSKKGSAIVVTDPGGDVHACVNADELWETLSELMETEWDDAVEATPPPTAHTTVVVEEAPPPRPRASAPAPEPAASEDDAGVNFLALAMSAAGTPQGQQVIGNFLSGLRNMSHRGSDPIQKHNRKKKKKEEE